MDDNGVGAKEIHEVMMQSERDIYLVGSVPLTRPYDVFTSVAQVLGDRIARVPDGEIGDRIMWVQCQISYLTHCPVLEVCELPEDGPTRQTGYQIPVRLKPGATESDVVFPDIGYARHAENSYQIFRALKRAGKIPARWRFQVCVPTPMDVMTLVEPGSRPVIERAWEAALIRELAEIQDAIPDYELAISIDVVQGLLLWEDPDNIYVEPYLDATDGYRPAIVERLARLANHVEPEVELGFHCCYGSQDHKHAIDPADSGAMVDMVNRLAKALDRPITYVHMPVPRDRDDDAYFVPLANLDPGTDTKLYLGLIHYTDGVKGAQRRISAAARHRREFGISTECGFGRRPAHQDILRLLELHRDVA
jgi:hypothetical protein